MAKVMKAQIQIDTQFITNAKALSKQIEQSFSTMDLTKPLSNMTSNLVKTLQSQLDTLEKQMSTTGKSKLDYTKTFATTNTEINETLNKFRQLKHEFTTLYNSKDNQNNLKELDRLKKKYEELDKLAQAQSKTEKLRQNAVTKLENETGSKYAGTNKKIFGEIYNSFNENGNDSKFTARQKELLGIYDAQGKLLEGQEKTLRKMMEHLRQIREHDKTGDSLNKQVQAITGSNRSNASKALSGVNNDINNLLVNTITPEQLEEAITKAKEAKGPIKEMVGELAKAPGEIEKADEKTQQLSSTMSTLKEIAAQFGLVWSAGRIARAFKDLINYSLDFYKQLDSALNQIYVVSDLSLKAVNDLTSSFISMASRTGMAIDDVTTAAVLFFQQGLNKDEVITMTEVTAQFAKVAGIDATDAANKLTAAVNGYCLSAEDAANVADKFNRVAASSAADINELSTAFSKAAAQANQAGVSMDNYLAYIATMEEATREAPENIGTSLKTIFSRMQQIKTGENTEDNVDVNQVETALKTVGIQLRDVNGQLRDLEEIFAELGPQWNTLDRNTQAYIGTMVAGTRQQSRFITLMQNWERVLDLANQSENSAGMQALMHAKAMDSITSKLEQMKVAWQKLVSNLASSKLIKDIISSITNLINKFNTGKAPVVALTTVLTVLMTRLAKVKFTFSDLGKTLKSFSTSLKGQQAALKGGMSYQQLQQQSVKLASQLESEKGVCQGLMNARAELETQGITSGKQWDDYTEQINQSKTQQEKLTVSLQATTQAMDSQQKVVANAFAAAGTLIGVVTTIVGLLDGLNDQTGQIIIGITSIVSAILAGLVAIKVGLAATGIGAFISLIGMAITGIITLYKALNVDKEELKKNGLAEAIESLAQGLDDIQAKSAGVRSITNLIKEYQKLNGLIYKTGAQQERMNDIARELSETLEIDTITDAYGNLTINIDEANEALAKQNGELEDLKDKMKDLETDAMLKAVNSGNSVDEYLNTMYQRYASDYKSMIQGLSGEYENITDNVLSQLNNALKNAVMQYAKELKTSNLTEFIETFNENLNKNLGQKVGDGATGYEKIYDLVNKLRSNADNLTYADVMKSEQEFFDDFGKRLGITQQQWDVLTKSINTTVFGNDSLVSFIDHINDVLSRLNGSKWNDDITGLLKSKENELESYFKKDLTYSGFLRALSGKKQFRIVNDDVSMSEVTKMIKELHDEGKSVDTIVSKIHDKYGKGSAYSEEWDANADSEKIIKKQKEFVNQYISLYEDFKNRLPDFKKEFGIEKWADEDAMAFGERLSKIQSRLQSMNAETATFFANNQELLDISGLTPEDVETVYNALDKLDSKLQTFDTDAQRYAYLQENFMNAIFEENPDVSEQAKAKAQAMLDSWFSGLKITGDISWSGFAKEVDNIGKELKKVDSILKDLKDDGHISIDTFLTLGDVLTNLMNNAKSLGAQGQLGNLSKILDGLNVKFDKNTKSLMVNKGAVENLAKLETVLAKAKLYELKTTIDANLLAAQSRLVTLETEYEVTKNMIQWAHDNADAQLTSDQIIAQAQEYMTTEMGDDVEQIQNFYETMTKDSKTWATATVGYVEQVSKAINKLFTGEVGFDGLKAEIERIQQEALKTGFGGVKWLGIDPDNKDYKILGSDLEKKLGSYLTAIENTITQTKDEVEYYKSMQITVGSLLAQDDLSGLFGGNSKDSKETEKRIERYIGKLREVFNILNRIAMLEHRKDMLDNYSELLQGEAYGKNLRERIKYTHELGQQYNFLTTEEKKFTNGYKEFIESMPELDEVFDFDEFGQIIINFDKYNALQDKAIDGVVTWKEKADDVYETYQKLFDETKESALKAIEQYKAEIKLNQEMVDAYKTLQQAAVDAVKDIYQQILDTKLDAIEKEKEAIEELREAREQARKDQQNSKELSGLQTNLQRAMMDTSGASDSAFIKAQKDIDDKLDKIADDKYSSMLKDITDALEEEKSALQKNFDELWDNLDWLHTWLDADIMGDKSALFGLLKQSDTWQQKSDVERRETEDDWGTLFHTYYEDFIEDEKGIVGIYDRIGEARAQVEILDANLKTNLSQVGTDIATTIAKWQKEEEDAKKNTTTSNSSGSGNQPSKTKQPTKPKQPKPTPTPKAKEVYSIMLDDGYMSCDMKKVTQGDSLSLPTKTRSGYKFVGWYIPSLGKTVTGSYKPTRSETITAKWEKKSIFAAIIDGAKSLLGITQYASGGMNYVTGPAWLDGTPQHPEAVLNPLQTEHFARFTNTLDKMYQNNSTPTNIGGSVNIENILFQVESMSSPEDGEKAFNMFVQKFKEIGSQSGISMNNFKNTK